MTSKSMAETSALAKQPLCLLVPVSESPEQRQNGPPHPSGEEGAGGSRQAPDTELLWDVCDKSGKHLPTNRKQESVKGR